MSNVKQLALAYLMYANDYNGIMLPGDTVWFYDALEPYMKNQQIVMCPSDPRASNRATSYVMSPALIGAMGWGQLQAFNSRDLYACVAPAQKYLFADKSGASALDNIYYFRNWDSGSYPNSKPAPHNDGYNVSYCDGHAGWLTRLDPVLFTEPGQVHIRGLCGKA